MNNIIYFVKTGWLIVAIACTGFAIYTLIIEGLTRDVVTSIVFAVVAVVMYYVNSRRLRLFKKPTDNNN